MPGVTFAPPPPWGAREVFGGGLHFPSLHPEPDLSPGAVSVPPFWVVLVLPDDIP